MLSLRTIMSDMRFTSQLTFAASSLSSFCCCSLPNGTNIRRSPFQFSASRW